MQQQLQVKVKYLKKKHEQNDDMSLNLNSLLNVIYGTIKNGHVLSFMKQYDKCIWF